MTEFVWQWQYNLCALPSLSILILGTHKTLLPSYQSRLKLDVVCEISCLSTCPQTPCHSELSTNALPLRAVHKHLASQSCPQTLCLSELSINTQPLRAVHKHLAAHSCPQATLSLGAVIMLVWAPSCYLVLTSWSTPLVDVPLWVLCVFT